MDRIEFYYFELAIWSRIRDTEGKSTLRQQGTGTRQGCRLPPYLFIILTTGMMQDVHADVGRKAWTKAAKEAGTTDLLYADDTVIISSKAKAVNTLIAAIKKHSERYGMSLNKEKCEYFGINSNHRK